MFTFFIGKIDSEKLHNICFTPPLVVIYFVDGCTLGYFIKTGVTQLPTISLYNLLMYE